MRYRLTLAPQMQKLERGEHTVMLEPFNICAIVRKVLKVCF
jgi:hypothetical protein